MKQKSAEDGQYNKQELIDELKIFLFAGSDTTAHLMKMMVYNTAKHV